MEETIAVDRFLTLFSEALCFDFAVWALQDWFLALGSIWLGTWWWWVVVWHLGIQDWMLPPSVKFTVSNLQSHWELHLWNHSRWVLRVTWADEGVSLWKEGWSLHSFLLSYTTAIFLVLCELLVFLSTMWLLWSANPVFPVGLQMTCKLAINPWCGYEESFWDGVLKMEHCIQQVFHFFTWPSFFFWKENWTGFLLLGYTNYIFRWETTLLLVMIMGTICNIAMGMITGAICSKVLLTTRGNGNRIPMYWASLNVIQTLAKFSSLTTMKKLSSFAELYLHARNKTM